MIIEKDLKIVRHYRIARENQKIILMIKWTR